MTDYNDGSWHGWNGGECPVHPETMVEVAFSNTGERATYGHQADNLYWENGVAPSDIIAFRVVKEHREPHECWVNKALGIVRWVPPDPDRVDDYIHVMEVMK